MLGKKLINSGPISSGANTFASENFNTVLYTGNGGTQRIGGYINRGAVFNGSAYITTGYTAVSSTAASISLWVNIAAYTTYGGFAIDSTGTGAEARFTLGQGSTGGKLWVSVGNGSSSWYDETTVSISSYGLNNWFHLAGTVNGTTVKIYINGSLIHTFTSSVSYVGGGQHPYYLGGWGNSLRLNGKLDQVRFFKKALSQSEVTTLYGETFASTTISTTDIFNDNSGVALYQLDGNANDTGGASGRLAGTESAIFSNSNSNFNLGTATVIDNNFGISFWVKVNNINSGSYANYIFAFMYGQNFQCRVAADGELRIDFGSISADCSFGTTHTFTEGVWYHVAITGTYTSSPGTVTVYVNGSSVGSGSNINGHNTSMNLANRIGSYHNATTPLDGQIEEFRIYKSTSLSASDITALYSGTPPTTGLTNYFKFNGSDRNYASDRQLTPTNVIYNYPGTATDITYQAATNFSPDLVWIKQRTGTANHILFDSVRGVHRQISSSATYGQVDRTSADKGVISFNTNGFTLKDAAGGDYEVNGPPGGQWSGNGTYVAWCFNAGSGNAASNTDGTITSTVKANTAAGFSIVKWTGNGTNGATIGHGLSSAPEIIITKGLSNATSWIFGIGGISGFGVNDYMTLQTTAAKSSTTTFYQAYSADTFQVGVSSANEMNKNSSNDYISYCFHSVAGYQKIGTYTGTGATGNIVETGFEPAFVMIKNTDGSDSWDRWYMSDNKRLTDGYLYANANLAEAPYQAIKMLSNGFEVITNDTGVNQSSNTYVYLAIAADPDTTTPTIANSFDVVTYTGTNSTQSIDVDFKPDLIWFKNRTGTNSHAIIDSVRGRAKSIYPDANYAENTSGASNDLVSFDDNGFTVGSVSQAGSTNTSGGSIVAWCWKANDHDDNLPQILTNSDAAAIDVIASVNDEAGFSIVTGTLPSGSAETKVPHGLSEAPDIVIAKTTGTSSSHTSGWQVFHKDVGAGNYLEINTNAAAIANTNVWANTTPTSELVSLKGGYILYAGVPFVMYSWKSKTGYSKIGSYTGTGSAQTINTGFVPRFVMIKNTSSASTNWTIIDSLRDNGDEWLYANSSSSAYDDSNTYTELDGITQGFKLNVTGSYTNTYGDNYIYMAFK